jgi:transglutaminase-like putative cysteine protease
VSASLASLGGRSARRFSLSERIRYDYSQPVTNLRQQLKVVPPSIHGGQLRRSWQLSVGRVPVATRRAYLDEFGNVTVEVVVPRVEKCVELLLDVEVDLEAFEPSFDVAVDRRYLWPTHLTAPCQLTAELAAGAGFGDVESLCAKVHRSISYGWGHTGIDTPAAQALVVGKGVCQDYAHIMLAACRSAGLPARYVSGHLLGEGGSHAWVEVLHPHPYLRDIWVANGWDPTHNRRVNADYLVVALGRDYADAAPLSGSYVGAGTNTLRVEKRLDVT